MTKDPTQLLRQLTDLGRQKQRALRRGDYNFTRISKEHKAIKAALVKIRKDATNEL